MTPEAPIVRLSSDCDTLGVRWRGVPALVVGLAVLAAVPVALGRSTGTFRARATPRVIILKGGDTAILPRRHLLCRADAHPVGLGCGLSLGRARIVPRSYYVVLNDQFINVLKEGTQTRPPRAVLSIREPPITIPDYRAPARHHRKTVLIVAHQRLAVANTRIGCVWEGPMKTEVCALLKENGQPVAHSYQFFFADDSLAVRHTGPPSPGKIFHYAQPKTG